MIFEIESWPLKVRFWQSIEYLEMLIFGQLHCVANVYAVWSVYTVKCLCSRGWD